jgi:hypothetical protein
MHWFGYALQMPARKRCNCVRVGTCGWTMLLTTCVTPGRSFHGAVCLRLLSKSAAICTHACDLLLQIALFAHDRTQKPCPARIWKRELQQTRYGTGVWMMLLTTCVTPIRSFHGAVCLRLLSNNAVICAHASALFPILTPLVYCILKNAEAGIESCNCVRVGTCGWTMLLTTCVTPIRSFHRAICLRLLSDTGQGTTLFRTPLTVSPTTQPSTLALQSVRMPLPCLRSLHPFLLALAATSILCTTICIDAPKYPTNERTET